jgi:hypothetical protein
MKDVTDAGHGAAYGCGVTDIASDELQIESS